jgi:hypothetical protein
MLEWMCRAAMLPPIKKEAGMNPNEHHGAAPEPSSLRTDPGAATW